MSVRVQTGPFDLAAESNGLTEGRTDIGAIVCFTGRVRDGDDNGRRLLHMTLEHYPGMTEAELGRAEAKALRDWPLTAALVVHRVGELRPGDDIVLVITASRHRQAALDAASFLMDYLKSRAPFWKKETFIDGTSEWVEARFGDEDALARWQP